MNRPRSTARLFAALTTLCAVAAPSAHAAPVPDGPRTAWLEYGYPHPGAPDCNEGSGPGVCRRDVYGFWQGQCTSWVAHRLNRVGGLPFVQNRWRGIHWGNAGTWGATARARGIPVDSRPAVGAVAWYGRSPGHVAYVEQVNGDGSVLVSEMNVDNHNAFRFRVVQRGTRDWPTGFIHLADVPAATPTLGYRIDGVGRLFADTLAVDGAASELRQVGHGWGGMGLVTRVDDLTADRLPDVVARRNATGELFLYPSADRGGLGASVRIGTGWNQVVAITDAGRLDGGTSRRLVALYRDGRMVSFRLTRAGLSQPVPLGATNVATRVTGVGDVTGDGRDDLLLSGVGRSAWLLPGTASGRLGAAVAVPQVAAQQVVSHQQGRLTLLTPTGHQATRWWSSPQVQVQSVTRSGHRLA